MVEQSKSQVNKAGKTLRAWERGDPVTTDQLWSALHVLRTHRRAHRVPLNRAAVALRSHLGAVGCEPGVTQRLKRERTIIDKLRRQPTMRLATMRDIAGCRATVPTLAEL